MADVTLAEAQGQAWLVEGEQYVDDLLANTLAPDVTVEIVACATRAEAFALWEARLDGPPDGAMPWMIHPGILRRLKTSADAERIQFAPWSAMVTEEAQAAIAVCVRWLEANPAGRLTLRQFCPAELPQGLADLQRLRRQLVAAAFARLGEPGDRLNHETSPSEDPSDADHLAIVSNLQAVINAD